MVLLRVWLVCACLLYASISLAADLTRIERRIARQPTYHTKPRYCLVVFGPEATTRVWLVLDGDTLYVDRNGDGDLTEPGKKFTAEKKPYSRGSVFNVGDISVGAQRYRNLEVQTENLKDLAAIYEDWPVFQKMMAAHPDAVGYTVVVDVPVRRGLPDGKGGRLTQLRHYASLADANGFLQFADRPETAPVIHFGGPWSIWPREGQRLVFGRPYEFSTVIGTPGVGPGTLALIPYHALEDNQPIFVPKEARTVLEMCLPGKGGKPVTSRVVLENRC
jgi:hypothetical protein